VLENKQGKTCIIARCFADRRRLQSRLRARAACAYEDTALEAFLDANAAARERRCGVGFQYGPGMAPTASRGGKTFSERLKGGIGGDLQHCLGTRRGRQRGDKSNGGAPDPGTADRKAQFLASTVLLSVVTFSEYDMHEFVATYLDEQDGVECWRRLRCYKTTYNSRM
jgi:hypothetical protein